MSKGGTWAIEAVVDYIQANHVFLHFDTERGIDLWTPHRKVPIGLRRAIVKHRAQLHTMMLAGDSRVCPSPRLHKRYWRRAGRRQSDRTICSLCLQLDRSNVVEEEGNKTA